MTLSECARYDMDTAGKQPGHTPGDEEDREILGGLAPMLVLLLLWLFMQIWLFVPLLFRQ